MGKTPMLVLEGLWAPGCIPRVWGAKDSALPGLCWDLPWLGLGTNGGICNKF